MEEENMRQCQFAVAEPAKSQIQPNYEAWDIKFVQLSQGCGLWAKI